MIAKVFPEVFQKLTFVFSAKENLNTFQNMYLPHSPFPGPAFIRKGPSALPSGAGCHHFQIIPP